MKFCNICSGRVFTTFNGRVDAQCQNCGSLERHRSLALFLLSLPHDKERKICVLSRNSKLPKYCEYLSPLHGSFEVANIEQNYPSGKKYNVVIHDHLLHDSEEIWGINNYSELVHRSESLLSHGGLQVFAIGKVQDLSRFFDSFALDDILAQGLLFQPVTFGVYPPQGKVVLFSPFNLFGEEIAEQVNIGYSISRPLNGNSTLCRLKG